MIDPVMICSTWAKSQYGLSEADLSTLECHLKRNPYYRTAAPMRLYALEDVERVSDYKRSPEGLAEAVRVKEAARLQAERARLEADERLRRQTEQHALSSTHMASLQTGSQMTLPQDVLELIATSLATSSLADPSFRRTFATRVQDLASLCMACSEFRSAVIGGGWATLEAEATQANMLAMAPYAETLTTLVSSTSASVDLSMKALRSVAQALDVSPLNGTKLQLTHRIRVDGLGLPDGRPLVAAKCPFVVLQLRKERKRLSLQPTMEVRICRETHSTVSSVAGVSTTLARRFSGVDGLTRYRACVDELRERDCKIANESLKCAAAFRARQRQDAAANKCGCGNIFSSACVQRQCKACCRDPTCRRHR